MATAERRDPFVQKLTWKSDHPVWVEQWPLNKIKLQALTELVEEQLRLGNIEPSMSPWNSPVFVIRKPGKDKWRLLHDLRQINAVIEEMGPLQPGMPSPAMLPKNWQLAVIDIKDCFFSIPLHPDDAPRFAFSVPSLNREAPMRRYHWRVLPQGMKNSPSICQWFVARVLEPVRKAKTKAIIMHYMDDILVCTQDTFYLEETLNHTIQELTKHGFKLQPDKIQKVCPWTYLGLKITETTISPQPLKIINNPQTLVDLQQLCGAIAWVRQWLGLTTEDIAPLLNLLRGEQCPDSKRQLTPEAREAIGKVESALAKRQAHRCLPGKPFLFAVLGRLPHLSGLIFQLEDGREDSLVIIEWVFLPHQPSKSITTPQELVAQLVMRARSRLRSLVGCDFECMFLPFKTDDINFLLETNEKLQIALDSYSGQISQHYLKLKKFNPLHPEFGNLALIPREIRSPKPLKTALTIFTDGSGKTKKSVFTWLDPQTSKWEEDVEIVEGSPQVAELAAVVRALQRFPEQPINIITDSAYVAGVTSRADSALLKQPNSQSNKKIFYLLSQLVYLVSHREQPFFIMHLRSHTDLPGPLVEGNKRADTLAAPVQFANLPNIYQQAKISHQQFHQNVPALVRMFHLKRDQARAIVATCPNCNRLAMPSLGSGANPRGLQSCELWQTDVTHVPEFGRQKYVHVSVDTFSGAVFASAHHGETAKDVERHYLQAFATLGIPKSVKTDNGPAYVSERLKKFFQRWGISHSTGIPHSPTGQAVVERTHKNIKRLLEIQKGGDELNSPPMRLTKVLFTLNFLNGSEADPNPPVLRHFQNSSFFTFQHRPKVWIRDPETRKEEGPYELQAWGRGYACVSTASGTRWIPRKWVRPFVEKTVKPKTNGQDSGSSPKDVTVASLRRRRRPIIDMEDKCPESLSLNLSLLFKECC